MMRDFLIKLLRSILEIPHKSLFIPSADHLPYHHESRRAALSGYALGWKEGLEAAVRYLDPVQQTGNTGKELTSLSLTPWPEHPEYGWKSGRSSEGESKVDVIDNLTSQLNNLKCDTCGKPATNMARDIHASNNPTSTVNSYEPSDTIKLGCSEHLVKSHTVIGTSPLQPVYDSLDELYATREILENCRCAVVPLDCQGLDLNSSTGKIDYFIDPVSSGSDSWTGADDDLNNFTGGHTV